MNKVWEIAEPLGKKCDIQGGLVVLLNPIEYLRLRFRGWRYMEPEFVEKYHWPQKSMPVKRTVKIEQKPGKQGKAEDLPLFCGSSTKTARLNVKTAIFYMRMP